MADSATIDSTGLLADVEQEMRSYADTVLAPPFQKLVGATQEPFVQAILDLGVPQMTFGRVALIGDAAFIPRHTAAGTAKAAARSPWQRLWSTNTTSSKR